MPTNPSTQVRPVVLNLLSQAEVHFRNAEGKHAEAFYRAAVAADFTPLATIELSTFLHYQQHTDEAISLLTQAWEDAKSLQNSALRAQACYNLAAIYREQGQAERAFQFQQLAISAELDGFDVESQAVTSEEARLGQALDDLGKGQVQQAINSLRSLERSTGDAETRSICLLNLASLAFQHHDTATALGYAQQAFSIARKAHDAPTLLSSLELLVELLIQTGHWHEAEVCLDQACEISERLATRVTSQHLEGKRSRLKNALGFLNADPILN